MATTQCMNAHVYICVLSTNDNNYILGSHGVSTMRQRHKNESTTGLSQYNA